MNYKTRNMLIETKESILKINEISKERLYFKSIKNIDAVIEEIYTKFIEINSVAIPLTLDDGLRQKKI